MRNQPPRHSPKKTGPIRNITKIIPTFLFVESSIFTHSLKRLVLQPFINQPIKPPAT